MKRSCAILLGVSSLPSDHGIGTLGKEAYNFIDFLKAAGQTYWQMLPLGPTGYGDSPYATVADKAGNPYFIDLDLLMEDGLLTKEELAEYDACAMKDVEDEYVDYGKLYEYRFDILRKAYDRGKDLCKAEFEAFASENTYWLDDYAVYMSVKKYFGMKSWQEWEDEDIRMHRPAAINKYREMLRDDVDFYAFLQYLFFSQWAKLKAYAVKNGIKIIGDVPIYVAMDSADVWSEPHYFQLDEKNIPIEISGVPPDYFSEDGQLWGNPLYRWDKMEADGYGWWIRRISAAARLYDVIRIDHFRGFASYWSVPYGEKTAKNGHWVKGPGIDFVNTIKNWFSGTEFIAEDLGEQTPDVAELLEASGLPGMKVLQFAFNPEELSDHLPQFYKENCICYTGTHDNSTLEGWEQTKEWEVLFAAEYLGVYDTAELSERIIRAGMASTARLFVAQMQDYLWLGDEARMNTPGTAQGNWKWRMKKEAADESLSGMLMRMMLIYGRKP